MTSDRLLTAKEAAAIVGVTRSTVWKIRHRDKTFPEPVVVPFTGVRYRESELLKWLASLPHVSELTSRRAEFRQMAHGRA